MCFYGLACCSFGHDADAGADADEDQQIKIKITKTDADTECRMQHCWQHVAVIIIIMLP